MAATAILNFGKMSITPDWIKICTIDNPNINRGTSRTRVCPRRCGTRCRGKAARGEAAAYAAKPQAMRRSRGLASCRGKAARGEAAYNLVEY